MDVDELVPALLGVVAMVVVAPAMLHYLGTVPAPEPEHALVAGLVVPGFLALHLSSWVRPELAGTVTGLLLLVSVMAMAPWLMSLVDLMAGEMASGSVARLLARVSVAALVLVYLFGIAYRRVGR